MWVERDNSGCPHLPGGLREKIDLLFGSRNTDVCRLLKIKASVDYSRTMIVSAHIKGPYRDPVSLPRDRRKTEATP